MQCLEREQRIDFGGDNPALGLDYLFGAARGQMFGALKCLDKAGNLVFLKAFSGQYNGIWQVDGWVPPILDVARFDALVEPVDREIKRLGREGLLEERKRLSQQLMLDIHDLYDLRNFRGECAPMSSFFSGGIPTGTGDCCAPKLLNHAASNGLRPVAITEFYWGRENRSGTRQHGNFYEACADKCQPILGFMLCGCSDE